MLLCVGSKLFECLQYKWSIGIDRHVSITDELVPWSAEKLFSYITPHVHKSSMVFIFHVSMSANVMLCIQYHTDNVYI